MSPPCGYCLEASMTAWWDCLVFTLTFDSSPVKGEGDLVVLDLFSRAQAAPLD